ncbi:MAG: gluconate 2-dehydrogenase subunit 3 family protein [Xanthobacteraceae bacterium]|nr:gluconate 2-dehydrogenase subunit 3 family protein [Xanthobacteraceae bacterium]
MTDNCTRFSRRFLLASSAAIIASGATNALARTITQKLPWEPGTARPPGAVRPGPWMFFSADEASTIEAIVERLIPPDEKSIGGKDAGCAVFIDRQLAGPYGRGDGLYTKPPFMPGVPTQGYQSEATTGGRYRSGLRALADYVKSQFEGKSFAQLAPADQDKVLSDLESGKAELKGVKGTQFFELLLQNTQEGFFADPIYGGNKDMAGWRMIGFPGAHYDYRDWIERHNEPYPFPPVSIMGRSDWTVGSQ